MKFTYPQARRDETVFDDYHGTKIADPYRWLEDPDSEETKEFVDAQNAVSGPFIEECEYRQKIKDSLTEKWNFAKYSSPAEHGGHYYYYHNSGLQNQSVMYVQDSPKGEARVFLDPNKLSEDGTLAISGTAFSEDGSFFAYGLSQSGSDWITIKFKECPSGKDLPDTLEHVKFSSMAWTHDNKGMFYNRYPVDSKSKSDGTETTSNYYHRLYYHVLGTDQSEDVLAVEFSNEPKWLVETTVANGNSIYTPHFSLPLSNNNANQTYQSSYMVSTVAVAAGYSNSNPFYGASAPPAYSNYYTPSFYGLSYSPSKSPINFMEKADTLQKQTIVKPNPKEKVTNKKKHQSHKKGGSESVTTQSCKLGLTDNKNSYNENSAHYGYHNNGYYNYSSNASYHPGSYGYSNYSYWQHGNGSSSNLYHPTYGTWSNQYYNVGTYPYASGSSYSSSTLTNQPQTATTPIQKDGQNALCFTPTAASPSAYQSKSVFPSTESDKYSTCSVLPQTESVTSKLRTKSPSPLPFDTSVTYTSPLTYSTSPTSPVSYSYPSTGHVTDSASYGSIQNCPAAKSVSYPSYPVGVPSSYPPRQTYPVAEQKPYPPRQPCPAAEQKPYPPRQPYPAAVQTSYPPRQPCPAAEQKPYPPCQPCPAAEQKPYPPRQPYPAAVQTSYPPSQPWPAAEQTPYPPRQPCSVAGLTSYSHQPCSATQPASYQSSPVGAPSPYSSPCPLAESTAYPFYPPNSSASYPFYPYWYPQNGYPYSSYSNSQQPQPAYNQNWSSAWPPQATICDDQKEATNKGSSKIGSHSRNGKVASTPDTMFVPNYRGAEVSDCGKYLLLTLNEGCDPVNRLFYVELDKLPNGITGILPYTILVDNFDAQYEYITNEGTVFTFLTNLNSPKYKVINIDFNKPEQANWQTLIEEDENAVLEWVSCVDKNKLILCYLEDVKNKMYIHNLETGKLLKEIPLDIGTVIGCSGKKKNKEIFIHFVSFLTPGIIYRVDVSVDDPKPEVYRMIKVSNFDFSQFEIKQIFYPSKDGTKIPMFLIHKQGLVLDGKNPTYLYGYGGFEISIKPSFNVNRLVFLKDLGGLFAIANIRGGGEYGETWHKSGTHSKKQNVFDDFQAAAEYLIDHKYTTPKKLVIHGHSNGGLLIAACINQRPELYGSAVAQVGVLDMLRFHKFTIGHAWTTDFGCSDVPDHFKFLIKYSPLHNIRVPKDDVQYPSTLLVTADHDDRVVPLHSLKYIAELQNLMKDEEKQTSPLMIKVDTKAGHGRGKPTSKSIQEYTDLYCFITKTLELSWHES